MRTTNLLLAALISAALMGCGGMQIQGMTPTSTCKNTEICEIPVSVVACVVTIPSDKEVIEMKGNYVSAFWQLDDQAIKAKYQFDKDTGVVLDPRTPDNSIIFGKQFSGQKAINNKTGFVWIDKNSSFKTYKYTINIIDTSVNPAVKCTPLDPHFANN